MFFQSFLFVLHLKLSFSFSRFFLSVLERKAEKQFLFSPLVSHPHNAVVHSQIPFKMTMKNWCNFLLSVTHTDYVILKISNSKLLIIWANAHSHKHIEPQPLARTNNDGLTWYNVRFCLVWTPHQTFIRVSSFSLLENLHVIKHTGRQIIIMRPHTEKGLNCVFSFSNANKQRMPRFIDYSLISSISILSLLCLARTPKTNDCRFCFKIQKSLDPNAIYIHIIYLIRTVCASISLQAIIIDSKRCLDSYRKQ